MTKDCVYVAMQSGRLWLVAVGGSERVTAVLPSEDQEGQPSQLQDQRSSLRALCGNQFMWGPIISVHVGSNNGGSQKASSASMRCLLSLSVTRVLDQQYSHVSGNPCGMTEIRS